MRLGEGEEREGEWGVKGWGVRWRTGVEEGEGDWERDVWVCRGGWGGEGDEERAVRWGIGVGVGDGQDKC